MIENLLHGLRELTCYRTVIAIGLPLLGGALVVASSIQMPRGKSKGILTGAYLFLASLGAACLLCSLLAGLAGEPRAVVGPLALLGIVLTVIMGIFSFEVIHEYRRFEFRKLAAEIFRRG